MSNFYCAAPWRGLHINPRGNVKTCCAGNPNMLGNLNEHTIAEILNGDKLKEIRASIQAGIAHSIAVIVSTENATMAIANAAGTIL